MWYNIDFNKIAVLLLPTSIRKPKIIAYLKVLLSPVVELHELFLQKQKLDVFRLEHNGQVCYLRKALNDVFDNDLRRIEINGSNKFSPEFIYTPIEEKPKFLGTIFIHSKVDYSDTAVDFIVRVPKSIYINRKYEIHKWIDFFKKGSKSYTIETF